MQLQKPNKNDSVPATHNQHMAVVSEEKCMAHAKALVQDWKVQAGLVNVHRPGSDGVTILYNMVGVGYLSPVKYLIEVGGGNPTEPMICHSCWGKCCPIHSSTHSYKSGPLISAVMRGHLNLVKYLISIAPSIAVDEDFGCVAVAAGGEGALEMVRCLLEAGGDKDRLHVNTKSGLPPITIAAANGRLDVVLFLIAQG